MKTRNFLLVIAILASISFQEAQAFNWKKCNREVGPGRSLVGFDGAFGLTSSSASWTSSTGACSMLGNIEVEKKVFMIANYENLKHDFSKGNGEYASAFASLLNCSTKGKEALNVTIKERFEEVFPANGNPENSYTQINKILNETSLLGSECLTQRNG